MAQQEFEPIPSGLDPVVRYYNDLHYAGHQTAGLITAIDRLYVETTGVSPTQTTLNELLVDTDSREVLEALLLLPFISLGGVLESTKPVDNIYETYKDASLWVYDLAKSYHNNACLDDPISSQDMTCSNSTTCPLRAMRYFLMDPVMSCDFTTVDFMVDPITAYMVAHTKATAFIDTCDDCPEYYKTYLCQFERQFADYY